MKNIFYFITCCFFCFSTTLFSQEKKANTKSLQEDIHLLLNNWHKAAATANYDTYFNSMDSHAVFVGTDASEVWSKEAFEKFSKPYFDKGKAWSFLALDRNIYLHTSEKIAWFDEVLDTWMGVCRGSGVVEMIDGNWKIKHYVLSVAVPNEDIKAVIEAKKEKDSLFIQKLKH